MTAGRGGNDPQHFAAARTEPRAPVSPGSTSERDLLERAGRGNQSAVAELYERCASWLRNWARGRLPLEARGALDTSDLTQDALQHTFARLKWFRSRHVSTLRMYLRRAVENRIRDELRRATRRRNVIMPDEPVHPNADAPQLRQLIDDETWRSYLGGLQRLAVRDRRLIVGRVELGYNYEQLALIARLPSPDAARKALGRALVRLGQIMADA